MQLSGKDRFDKREANSLDCKFVSPVVTAAGRPPAGKSRAADTGSIVLALWECDKLKLSFNF